MNPQNKDLKGGRHAEFNSAPLDPYKEHQLRQEVLKQVQDGEETNANFNSVRSGIPRKPDGSF
ncbi:hypothetical protein [Desertivirga xinjiangensis]|uniref:hypothetical protein n=1 Tax=Desertivirga xinjiangensis TaxID=539206 RepID=UPI00210AE477|nr:hypothetical protein [Pedobacter xinjiangensis]